MKCFKVPWTWTDSLAQPKQWKKDMRFGTWNRPLGRPRCRWEDNIKMDLREIGIKGAIL